MTLPGRLQRVNSPRSSVRRGFLRRIMQGDGCRSKVYLSPITDRAIVMLSSVVDFLRKSLEQSPRKLQPMQRNSTYIPPKCCTGLISTTDLEFRVGSSK